LARTAALDDDQFVGAGMIGRNGVGGGGGLKFARADAANLTY